MLSCRNLGNAGASSKKARRARTRDRLRSIDAHADQKGQKLRRPGNTSKIQEPHNSGNGPWRSANERGNTSKCSRSCSLHDSAVTRGLACRTVIRYALREARIHLWVGQWSKATSDQRWEENYMQDGKLRLLSTLTILPLWHLTNTPVSILSLRALKLPILISWSICRLSIVLKLW